LAGETSFHTTVKYIAQAGEQEILVKWSWTMNFWWNRYDPLKFLWDPRLVFTGLTVLGYNRATGELRGSYCQTEWDVAG